MSGRTENESAVDLPPEYCTYPDVGCEFGYSCLNCILPVCVYEEPGGKQKLMKSQRALEMARLYRQEKRTVKELAEEFKVSTRTVRRVLKKVLGSQGVEE